MRLIIFVIAAMLCMTAQDAHAFSAKISGLSDLTLPTWSIGDPGVSSNMDVCVYATGLQSGSYGVTASGGVLGFNLTDSLLHQLPYSLYWNDGGAGALSSTGTQMTSGIPLVSQVNASTSSNSCSGGATARVIVKISQTAMTAAIAGSYSGTVTLVVVPI